MGDIESCDGNSLDLVGLLGDKALDGVLVVIVENGRHGDECRLRGEGCGGRRRSGCVKLCSKSGSATMGAMLYTLNKRRRLEPSIKVKKPRDWDRRETDRPPGVSKGGPEVDWAVGPCGAADIQAACQPVGGWAAAAAARVRACLLVRRYQNVIQHASLLRCGCVDSTVPRPASAKLLRML